jgi:predicted PurR-regulated permease PerM
MSDSEFKFGVIGAFVALAVIVLLVMLIHHEVSKKSPRKTNIRVPRQTLWERTNRYHTKGN